MTSTRPAAPPPLPASMIGKDSAVEQAGSKAARSPGKAADTAEKPLVSAARSLGAVWRAAEPGPAKPARGGDRHGDRDDRSGPTDRAAGAGASHPEQRYSDARIGREEAGERPARLGEPHTKANHVQQQQHCPEWEHCLGALTVPSRGRRRSRGGRSHGDRPLATPTPAEPGLELANPDPAARRAAWSPGRWRPGAAHEPPAPRGARRRHCRDGDGRPKKPGKYVCPYCGRACAKPSVLKKHVRSHTGERPYPCLACGFSFKTKSNLYKHCKSHAHAARAAPAGDFADSPSDGERTDTDVEPFADEPVCRESPSLYLPKAVSVPREEFVAARPAASGGAMEKGGGGFDGDRDEPDGEAAPGPAASVALPQVVVVVPAGQGGRSVAGTESGPRSAGAQQVPAPAIANDLRSAKHRLWRKRELESNASGHLLTPSPFSSKGSTDSGYFSRSGSTELSLSSPLAPGAGAGGGGGGAYNASSFPFAFQGSVGRGRLAERSMRAVWRSETVEDEEEEEEEEGVDARTWRDDAPSRRGSGIAGAHGPHSFHDAGRRRSSSADPPVSVASAGAKCHGGEFLDVPVFETGGFFRSNSMPTCNPSQGGRLPPGYPAGASLSFDGCVSRKGCSTVAPSLALAYATNPRPLVRQQAVEFPACRDIQGRQFHEQTTFVICQSAGGSLCDQVVPLENNPASRPSHCPGSLDRTSLQGKRRKPKSIGDEDEPDFVTSEVPASGAAEPPREPAMDVASVDADPCAASRWRESVPPGERRGPPAMAAVAPPPALAVFAPRRGHSLESVVGRHAGNNEISVIQHTKLLGRPRSFERSDAERPGFPALRQSLSADRAQDGFAVRQDFPASAAGEEEEGDGGGAKQRRAEQPESQTGRNGKLTRQSKIPEILVTVEPDGDQQQSDYLKEEPCRKQQEEEFQWPRRSETLEKLPAEKLPPKKKRLRLSELGHSSVESSNDSSASAPLSRSPSADGALSHCSSLSASLDHAEGDDERPRNEPAERPRQEGAAAFLTVPGAPSSPLRPGGRGMRRAASEHDARGPALGPQEGRSRSFDDGMLSAPGVAAVCPCPKPAAASGERGKARLERQASLNGHPEARAPPAMAVDGSLCRHAPEGSAEYPELPASCGASPADVRRQTQPQHRVFRQEVPQHIRAYASSSERPDSKPYVQDHVLTVQRLESELPRPKLQWAPHHTPAAPPFPPLPLAHRAHGQNSPQLCYRPKQHFHQHALQHPFERFNPESSSRPPLQQPAPNPAADARSMEAARQQQRPTPVDVSLENRRSFDPRYGLSVDATAPPRVSAPHPAALAARPCGEGRLLPSPAAAVPVRRHSGTELRYGRAVFTSPSQLPHFRARPCQPAVVVCHVTGEELGGAPIGSTDETPRRSAPISRKDRRASGLGDAAQAAPSGCRLPPGAVGKRLLSPMDSFDVGAEAIVWSGEGRSRDAVDASPRREAQKLAEPPRLRKPMLVRQFCTTEPAECDGNPPARDAAAVSPSAAAPATLLAPLEGIRDALEIDARTPEPPSQGSDGRDLGLAVVSPLWGATAYASKSAAQVRVLLPARAASREGGGSVSSPSAPVLQMAATPGLLARVGTRPGLAILVADLAEVQQLIVPGLRALTASSWCVLNARARPSVAAPAAAAAAAAAADNKASVYGPWEPAKSGRLCRGLLAGVSTHAALGLLRSRQRAGPTTYSSAAASPASSCALVHSGWWRRLHVAQPIPALKSSASPGKPTATSAGTREKELERARESARESRRESGRERSAKGHHDSPSRAAKPALPCRIKIFDGGYKSNEEYVYVRGRGRGKYVCEECGIRCKKPSMLRKHIRSHSDLRPYRCHICSFAFKTKGNLTKHVKSKAHSKKCLEMGLNATMADDYDPEEPDPDWELSKGAREDHQFSDADDSDRDRDDDDDDDDDDEDEEGFAALASLRSDGSLLRSASPPGRWDPRGGTGERGARPAGAWSGAFDAGFDDEEVARLTSPYGATAPQTRRSPAAPALAKTPGGRSPSPNSGGGARSPYDASSRGPHLGKAAPPPNRLGVLLEHMMRERPGLARGCSLSPSRLRVAPRDDSPSPNRHGTFRTHSLSPYRRDVARERPPSPGAGRTHSLSPRRGGAAQRADDPSLVPAATAPPAARSPPPTLVARGAGGGRATSPASATPRPRSPLADARRGLVAAARHSASLDRDSPGSDGRGSACEVTAAQCYAAVRPPDNGARSQPSDDRLPGATPGAARPFLGEPRQLPAQLPARHLQLPKALPHTVAVVGSVHMIDMERVARAAGASCCSSLDGAAAAPAPERRELVARGGASPLATGAVPSAAPGAPSPFAFDSARAALRFRSEPAEFRAAQRRRAGDPYELAALPLSVACAVTVPARPRRPEEAGMHGPGRRPVPVGAGVSETAATM